MGIFRKKEDAEKTKASKADFKIIIWEDVGYSVREVKTIFAKRFVDEDKSVFIYNQSAKFMELYPQDMQDHANFNEKEIDKKLETARNKLKNIRNKPIEEYEENEDNTKDLEFEIMKLEAKKRSFKFTRSASYVSYDNQGQVTFNFLRKGTNFFPFKWDTDTNTIFTPSEAVKKDAGMLLRNKENKYNLKKLIEVGTLILLVVAIIAIIANILAAGWLWQKYDDSNLAQAKLESLENTNRCGEIVNSYAEKMEKILEEQSNRPQTVVSGLVPE